MQNWLIKTRVNELISINFNFAAARSPVFFRRDKVCLTAHIRQQSLKFVPSKLRKLLITITEVGGQYDNSVPWHWLTARTSLVLILTVDHWSGGSRSRAATLLLMKSLELPSNSLNSQISSSQSVAPPSNSFAKFSRSNGYYSQVLRVSWNIIGRWALACGGQTLQFS